MYRMFVRVSTALALTTVLAGAAVAATEEWQPPRYEFGAFGGIIDFDTARGLNGEIYGGRFGINMSPQFGIEAVVGASNATSPRPNVEPTTIWVSHVNMTIHPTRNSEYGAQRMHIEPFITGGVGSLTSAFADPINTPQSSASEGGISAQDQFNFNVGGGIKAWLSDQLALRAAVQGYWGNTNAEDVNNFNYEGGYATDIMATVGLSIGAGNAIPSPPDADLDGVPDDVDSCTDTPYGVSVDTFGCPSDVDRDGVPDYMDECAETPLHAIVDEGGCPVDSDADGVFDGLDRCLDTPVGAVIDERGCPIDSDSDGVFDGLDKCVETGLGVAVDADGCPEVKEIEQRLVLKNITFASGSADLLPSSYGALDEVAQQMLAYPGVKLEVRGYADSKGAASYNLSLTQNRAQSVVDYLVVNGVERSRLQARGYGEADPIAPNDTSEGRAMNRRVELHRTDK